MSFFESVAKFFEQGGVTMYITATAGVIGFAIAGERTMKLFKEYNKNNRSFMARVKELMMQNRMEDALQYCAGESGPLPRIVKSGLERAGCEESLIRQSMESTYLDETPKITERISYLSMIANAGMLFGLLGTVFGLIKQFSAVGSADASQKQQLMAEGIAHAMNNTALGLAVALPMLIFHGVLSARANHHIEELERGAAQFLDWMNLHNYGQLQTRMRSETTHLKSVSKAGNV
jgi:biopolymer transport protein ExbB